MKRMICVIMCAVVLLTGCAPKVSTETNQQNTLVPTTAATADNSAFVPVHTLEELQPKYAVTPAFSGLNDEELLSYLEDDIYYRLLNEIDANQYYIQTVDAIYVSREYLEETAYNSQSNIFFGYTLAELDSFFGDTKYVFTVGEDGQTTVVPIESVADEGFTDKALLNLAIGTGVILVCVVICVASEGAGAPAAAAIFAASAKTGAIAALSGGLIAGVTSGAVKAYQTGDFNEALKAAAVSGSEGYKWGAITGALAGGASETIALHGATANGLTMNEAALIQKQSHYPLEVIREFHSVQEYEVFNTANLQPFSINGKTALIRTDINPFQTDEFGVSNLEKMLKGRAPISSTGETFELHHIGQSNDGILAILTTSEHDNPALHGFKMVSEIDRVDFSKTRSEFWKTMGRLLQDLYGM